jgi:hypothetical protein
MRDALALALIRAEYCRAYASERSRLDEIRKENAARARVGRALRSIRTAWRGSSAAGAKSRRAAGAASPPD